MLIGVVVSSKDLVILKSFYYSTIMLITIIGVIIEIVGNVNGFCDIHSINNVGFVKLI